MKLRDEQKLTKRNKKYDNENILSIFPLKTKAKGLIHTRNIFILGLTRKQIKIL